MLRPLKNQEQINPWTFRQRETSRQLNDSNHGIYKPIKSLRQKLSFNKKIMQNQIKPNKNMANIYSHDVIDEQQSRVIYEKISKHSIQYESFENKQKIIPNFKFISFQYRPRPSKRKSKGKISSNNVSNSMRQYTDGLQIILRKDEKPQSQYQRILKVRRYFTQQKDYQDEIIQKIAQQTDLDEISKTQQLKKYQNTIKIIKTSKNHLREEVITKGRLYQKIQDICDRKGILGGGHLSTMKRNYNIKKLQKLLKKDKT